MTRPGTTDTMSRGQAWTDRDPGGIRDAQDRRKRQAKDRSTEKASRKAPQQAVNAVQEAVNAFKRASRDEFPGPAPFEAVNAFKCEICLALMKPGGHGQRKHFCSAKCRRLACFARQIAAALEAGEADGLRDLIEGLKRPC